MRERVARLVSMTHLPEVGWCVTLAKPGGEVIMSDACTDQHHAQLAVEWVIDQLTEALLDTDQ